MGTRGDFYVGRGETAEWLGSIAWDAYPPAMRVAILGATTEDEYRQAVGVMLAERDDATFPENGWPWPWDDSSTTDYAYSFHDGKVMASCFGSEWFDPTSDEEPPRGNSVAFPNMAARKAITLGARSGFLVFRG